MAKSCFLFTKKKTLILMIIALMVACKFGYSEDLMLKYSNSYKKNIETKTINTISLSEGYHEGLSMDGSNIWISNGKSEVVSRIEPAGGFTESVVFLENGLFWASDWDDRKIYEVKIEDNKMRVESEVSLAPAFPAGMVKVRESIYVIIWTRGVVGTKYHLIEFDPHRNILRKIKINRISEPSQMTWDGEHLYVTSWYSDLVYKINIDTLKIMNSFKSPAKKTTGIAWDQGSFWITGTHDDLYQVKIIE